MSKKEKNQENSQELLDGELTNASLPEDKSPLEESTEESVVEEPDLSPEEIAKAEAAEWREKYLRQLAEFDNFRKRTRLESETLGPAIREALIVSLLPVKDDFDRMLAGELRCDDAFHRGVELIHNKLNAFFEAQGVKVMEGRGTTFDPNRHDALMMQPTADFPAGTILEVVTPGYTMGDRVIRHAQVIVSSESEETDESDAGNEESADA